MLQVLIVDDEPFFLDFLTHYIDWGSFDAKVIGTALNGLLAMHLLQANPVDIVFTDIKMPIMNGLELISDGAEKYPDTQFVVLSSYSDFHMVGEAYKLGAKEYLLKSEITREQLGDVLSRCASRKRKVAEEEKRQMEQAEIFQHLSHEVNRLESMVYRNRYVILKNFYNSAIDRGLSSTALMMEKHVGDPELQAPPAALLLVQIRGYQPLVRTHWDNDHSSFEFAITNVLEEAADFLAPVAVFSRKNGEFILLFSEQAAKITSLQSLYEKIQAAFQDTFSLDTLVSGSIRETGEEGVATLYHRAVAAQTRSFLVGGKQLLLVEETALRESAPDDWDIPALTERFSRLLKLNHVGELQEKLGEFQFSVRRYTPEQIESIYQCYNEYCRAIEEYLARGQGSERAEKKTEYFKEVLYQNGTLCELNEWLSATLTVLMQIDFNSTNLVRRAKRYVKEHYDEPLTLAVIAGHIGINPSYLSRVFSEAEGEGIMLYINKIRIQAATELLQTGGLRLYEIAEKVGYQNVEHFSRMFKKILGKSPREYMG